MDRVDFLEEFEKDLLNDGKDMTTVKSYTIDVKGFLKWLQEKNVEFSGSLTRFYIVSYKDFLSENSYKVNSINKKINSLHCFNKFLLNGGFCKEQVVLPRKDKIKVASGSEQEVEVFSNKEVEEILFYLESKKSVSQRDKVVILLLLYTGLRVSELVGIKLENIDLLTMQIQVVGKGGKFREVPLKSNVVDEVKKYIEQERREHSLNESKFLMLTQRAGKLDRDTVNKILRKHGRQLNLVMKPHKFRHTFCTRLLNKGVPLSTVAKLAGHVSVNTTTSFYINTSREDKQNAVSLL